jgi:hypothetical protein
MQTKSETHQEPKAHNKKQKAILLIILACVTSAIVAIPLIIAYLTPPLDFGWPSTEQIIYKSYTWGPNDAYINLTVTNTGPSTLTIAKIQVDGNTVLSPNTVLVKGNSTTYKITYAFQNGVQYNFMVVTAKGNQFGPYTLTAPSF